MIEIEQIIDRLVEQQDFSDVEFGDVESVFEELVKQLEWEHFSYLNARERQLILRLVYNPSFIALDWESQLNKAYEGIFFLRDHPDVLMYPLIKKLLGEQQDFFDRCT